MGGTLREEQPRSDGYLHVDTPAMIAKLRELGANTYIFGIWDCAADWDDLRLEFAPAALEAGIDIWVYLVPPSETSLKGGRSSRPYVMDYLAWARACATLAVEFSNVKAWGIDDFDFNQETFTPEYVQSMRAEAAAIAPSLEFYICTYYWAATNPGFLAKYGPYLDYVLYPYLDGHHVNTQNASAVAADLDAILEAVKPWDLGVVLLVYTGRFLDAWIEPTPEYSAACVRIGLSYASSGRIAGVTAYGLQLDDAPTITNINKAMYGNGRLSLVAPVAPTTPGSYAEASQVISVDPGSPRHEISFWHHDFVAPQRMGSTGKHVKQVLIDNEVVWSEDVTGHGFAMWQQCSTLHGPVDVSQWLRGKTAAKLSIRLLEGDPADERFPVDVGFDHIESIGFTVRNPGFEEPDGWDFTSSDGRVLAGIEIVTPDRPRRTFEAVAAAYKSAI